MCRKANFGVADGARTHDNRNHNLDTQSSIHAGYKRIHGKFWLFFTHEFIGFAVLHSHRFLKFLR